MRTIISASETTLKIEQILPKLVVHEQMSGGVGKSVENEESKAVAYAAGKNGYRGKSREKKGRASQRGEKKSAARTLRPKGEA